MAMSGSLREFSLSEIMQLVSSQRKTGCLTLERGGERASLYFDEGRIVASRAPGLSARDPLMGFLRRIHWLSQEQLRGIETLHQESGRDLVDILLNGRYLESEELTVLYERMLLNQLFEILQWNEGNYSFAAVAPPESALRLSFGTEAMLMEAVRRVDEHRRYLSELPEGHSVPGFRELPDPDADIGDDEKEILALVDGRRTIGEIIALAPLCDYEAIEGVAALFQNGWLEVVGSREVGDDGAVEEILPAAAPTRHRQDLVFTAALAALALALFFAATPLRRPPSPSEVPLTEDVFQRARWSDIEMALAVYEREKGELPGELNELVRTEWLTESQLVFPGYQLHYERLPEAPGYRLTAVREAR